MIGLEALDVTVSLGGRQVLSGLDLTLEPGTLTAVLGPNGAGKTTLLRCLSGEQRPERGCVRIGGTDIASLRARELAMLRSVLPQQHQVSFGFTSREIVAMGRAPHGDQDHDLVVEAMASTDTTHLADRPFRVLSGGEQARVALARILAQDTPVVLLDEPTAALDLHHQEHVMCIARSLARAGRTVVAIVHDLNLAAAHAERIVVLDQGTIAADGPPSTVIEAELVEAVYRVAVMVIEHPVRGCPLIVPVASPALTATQAIR